MLAMPSFILKPNLFKSFSSISQFCLSAFRSPFIIRSLSQHQSLSSALQCAKVIQLAPSPIAEWLFIKAFLHFSHLLQMLSNLFPASQPATSLIKGKRIQVYSLHPWTCPAGCTITFPCSPVLSNGTKHSCSCLFKPATQQTGDCCSFQSMHKAAQGTYLT